MRMVIDELVTLLGLELAPGVTEKIRKFDDMINEVVKTIGIVSTGLLTASSAIAYFAEQANQSTTGLAKLGDITGLNTEELQQAGYAAQMAGGSFDGMVDAMVQMAAKSPNASLGILNESLIRFGHGYDQATGKMKTGKDLLVDLAEGFAQLPDEMSKYQWAQELGVTRILSLLNKGPQYVKDIYSQIDKLPIISKEQQQNAWNFTIQLEVMSKVIKNIGQIAASVAAPAMERVVGSVTNWVQKNHELIEMGLARFLDAVLQTATWLGEKIQNLTKFFGEWKDVLVSVFPSLSTFFDKLTETDKIVVVLKASIIALGAILTGMATSATLAAWPFIELAAAIMLVVTAYNKLSEIKGLSDNLKEKGVKGPNFLESLWAMTPFGSAYNHYKYGTQMIPSMNTGASSTTNAPVFNINQTFNGLQNDMIKQQAKQGTIDALTQTYPGLFSPMAQ